jgi:regulator of replication initiation timing
MGCFDLIRVELYERIHALEDENAALRKTLAEHETSLVESHKKTYRELQTKTQECERLKYGLEKAVWCFKEGMYLCDHHGHAGSWTEREIVDRWEYKGWGPKRRERYGIDAAHQPEETKP